MSSRQQEKQQRREEREAAERAERERAARQRRLWTFGGIGLIAVAVIAGVVGIFVVGGGDSGPKKPGPRPAVTGSAIPAQKTSDLAQAAATARCTLHSYKWTPAHDQQHVPDGTKVKYKSNPPSFGPHYQTPASDGDYVGQIPPPTGNIVHALEHGRIEIQYAPSLAHKDVLQLEKFFQDDKAGQYPGDTFELIFQNKTQMPYQVAAAAWAHTLTCPKFNQGVFDALRAFRVKYTLQGPEKQFTSRE